MRVILMAVFLMLAVLSPAMAQDAATKPIQLAVFNPVQMVPEEESIKGLRLSLFYTVNQDMTGFSYAFLGVNRTTGDVKGVEWGLGNWTEGSFYGWQAGLGSYTKERFVGWQGGLAAVSEGDFTGLQSGGVTWSEGSFFHGWQAGWLVNYSSGDFVGLKTGLVNIAKGPVRGAELAAVNYNDASMKGFQGGFVNYAAEMHGLQLGFVNITKNLDGVQIGLGNYNGNKEPFEFLPFVNWSF